MTSTPRRTSPRTSSVDTPPPAIWLELSKEQVRQLLRARGAGQGLAAILRRGVDARDVPAALASLDGKRFSRSLLAGLLLFASFPRDGSGIGINDLSRLTAMQPSTTHRYATTLLEVGLVEQAPGSRRYCIPR